MTLVLILPLFLIAALATETFYHRRWLNRIPLRISVNGTRGKSSVAKYIAIGLQAAGKRPLAKITGTTPMLIFPDGQTKQIRRWGKPRVQEQLKVVKIVSKIGADVLVAECMAIAPELQITDSKIINPHLYIITNIHDDHREQFGGNLADYCAAICAAIPPGAIVITTEQVFLPQIRTTAASRNSTVILPDLIENEEIPADIFKSNLELAVKVCEIAGADPTTAMKAIITNLPESENPVFNVVTSHGKLRLVDGLAVNDTASAAQFWDRWRENDSEFDFLLLHTRSDRPLRTVQFARWIATLPNIERIILSGTHTYPALRQLVKNGVPKTKIEKWSRRTSAEVKNGITGNATIFGFGNTGDGGRKIWDELKIADTGYS